MKTSFYQISLLFSGPYWKGVLALHTQNSSLTLSSKVEFIQYCLSTFKYLSRLFSFGGHMFEKLSKEDFKFFLLNSKKEISYIFNILDDIEALDIISFLFYEPSNFKTLKEEFAHIEKNKLSSYLTSFWDFGIIEINNHNRYQITKTGMKFLQLTIQLVVESLVSQEVTDEKMRKILVQKVGEKELKQFKKERQENKAKGIQLSMIRI